MVEGCAGSAGAEPRRGSGPHGTYHVIGLDVHKRLNVGGGRRGGHRGGDVRFMGEIPSTPEALHRLVERLRSHHRRLSFCYEAGPCGYGVHRLLSSLGHCSVVAPSLIPSRPGDRVKTPVQSRAQIPAPDQTSSTASATSRRLTPVSDTAAVRRSPAVGSSRTSAFPRLRRLHPQQQTRRPSGLEGSIPPPSRLLLGACQPSALLDRAPPR